MSQSEFHPVLIEASYAEVILPLAIASTYTYLIPDELVSVIQVGMRVEVQFGKNKLYAALVAKIHQQTPPYTVRNIHSMIDDSSIIHPIQLQLWKWMAEYYCCTPGEVMIAALPAGLRLNSETTLTLSSVFDDNFEVLNDSEFLVAEALTLQEELKIADVQDILGRKNVYPVVNRLLEKKVVFLKETLKEKYKPKKVACVRLAEPYHTDREQLKEAFELADKSERQTEALMAFLQMEMNQEVVTRKDIYQKAQVNHSVIKALEKKGIFELFEQEISRLKKPDTTTAEASDLSGQQTRALSEIRQIFSQKNTVLLHGVTGSGKTRVYIELIQEVLARGGQVLYLLPEIALTTQIVHRLEKVFGEKVQVYNSGVSDALRVEIWKKVKSESLLVTGARSSLFLPFYQLDLIIVDEEHDPSFKQENPAPRYSARDTAVYMGYLHQARVLLGTATPSIESYQNVKTGKYGLVEMPERFGGVALPEIVLVDKKEEYQKKTMKSIFTSVMIKSLEEALSDQQQIILFQNRRGYAPVLRCHSCGWHQECVNCDVSMTYHQFTNNLKCHYCGHTTHVLKKCPACNSIELHMSGFGTQKIEDEIKVFFPDAKIARLDYDAARTRNAFTKIIHDFEQKRVDILIGTQMVTKGLDFDNVGVVGIMSSDQLLYFPDFRASERGFQLMTQVSGRAGRKKKRGKVIIQGYDTSHPVLQEVLEGNFHQFFTRELAERQSFGYPPYRRIIRVTLRHKKPQIVNEGAYLYVRFLKKSLGERVIGPAVPSVARVRNYYLLDVMIKYSKSAEEARIVKDAIREANHSIAKEKIYRSIRIRVNVDPN